MSQPRPPIRGLLLDWAGTTVDHGSRAPARVFVEVFRRSGVPVTEAEARGPMGMAKRAHIAAVLNLPRCPGLGRPARQAAIGRGCPAAV